MLNRLSYWSRFVKTYKNWFSILFNRLVGKKVIKVLLNNGYIVTGSEKSPLLTVMDETFLLRVYTPPFIPVDIGDIVVDIGANVGDFSIFASTLGASKVFSYEPDKESYGDLVSNIKNNNITNIEPVNKAVSNRKGRVKFYRTSINGGNSLYHTNDTIEKTTVISITLQDIFKYHNLKKIDFLKIDCEGSEGNIIYHTPNYVWKNIRKISLEYHDNVSQYSHNIIIRTLNNNGYETTILEISNDFGYIYAKRK